MDDGPSKLEVLIFTLFKMDEFSMLSDLHSSRLLILMNRTDESREALVRAERKRCCAPTKKGSDDNDYAADTKNSTFRSRTRTKVSSSTARITSIRTHKDKTCNYDYRKHDYFKGASFTSFFSSPRPDKRRRRMIKNSKNQEERNKYCRDSCYDEMVADQVATTDSGCVSNDEMVGKNTNSPMFLLPHRVGNAITTRSIATVSIAGSTCTALSNNVETDYANLAFELNEEDLEYLLETLGSII